MLQVLGKGGGEESGLQLPPQQGRQAQGTPGDTRRHLCCCWPVDNGNLATHCKPPSFRKDPLSSAASPPPGLSASPLNSAPESSPAGLFPGPGLCTWLASENSQGPKLWGGRAPSRRGRPPDVFIWSELEWTRERASSPASAQGKVHQRRIFQRAFCRVLSPDPSKRTTLTLELRLLTRNSGNLF